MHFFQLTSREKVAKDYNQKLKEKFQYHPHIKRIARHRHLPKPIYSQIQEQRIMREARRRKYVLGHLTFSNSPLTPSTVKNKQKPAFQGNSSCALEIFLIFFSLIKRRTNNHNKIVRISNTYF